MRERDLTFADLGAAIGRSAVTVRIGMEQRSPASKPIQAAQRAWLAAADSSAPARHGSIGQPGLVARLNPTPAAPAVAIPAAPFRGHTTDRSPAAATSSA